MKRYLVPILMVLAFVALLIMPEIVMSAEYKRISNIDSTDFTISSTGTLAVKSGGISSTDIENGSVVNEDISASAAITHTKLAAFAGQGYIMIGGAAGAPSAVDLSAAGRVLVGNGTTATAVDLHAGGNVLVGNDTSAAAVDFSGSAMIPIGNGTTLVSVDPAGDVEIAANGTTSISSGVVTSDDIKNDEIVDTDIKTTAAIAYSKLAALTSANILVGNGSNVPTVVDPTGDVEIDNTGTTSISSGVVTSDDVKNDELVDADIKTTAAISYSKLAALASANILVGNGSNVATVVDPAGDVEIDNAGATTIQADSVEKSMLHSNVAGPGISQNSDGSLSSDESDQLSKLAYAIDLSEAIRLIVNAHAADAAEHTAGADATNFPLTSAAVTNLATLKTFLTELNVDWQAHVADAELAAAWVFHQGEELADWSLASTAAPTTLNECIEDLQAFYTSYQGHDADTAAHDVGAQHQQTMATAGGFGIPAASVALSKLVNLTSGNIIVGNASNVPASVAMSGDVLISNAGATTIQADQVEVAMLSDGAQYGTAVIDLNAFIPAPTGANQTDQDSHYGYKFGADVTITSVYFLDETGAIAYSDATNEYCWNLYNGATEMISANVCPGAQVNQYVWTTLTPNQNADLAAGASLFLRADVEDDVGAGPGDISTHVFKMIVNYKLR